jgi:hypothetical protein
MIPPEFVGLFPRVTARQSDDPQDIGVFNAICVKVVLIRQRDLQHDPRTRREFVEVLNYLRL